MSPALALFLAALLAASALHKLLARERLAPVAALLARLAPALGLPTLLAAASLEAVLALALPFAELRAAGALGAAGLWSAYAVALAARRGEVLDCGCDLFAREKPVDGIAIARPLVLALLAAWLAASAPSAFTLDAPFAALGFVALWLAAGELAVLPHLAKVSRR